MWSKLLLTPKETMLKGRQLKNAEILWIELKERNKKHSPRLQLTFGEEEKNCVRRQETVSSY